MQKVFVLHHVREFDGEGDAKLIGIYSSHQQAESAINRLKEAPGFRSHPDGCQIESYELDQDHWVEGLVTLVRIYVRLLDEGTDVWRPVEAEWIANDQFRISSDTGVSSEEVWEFQPGDTVRCERRALAEGNEVYVAVARV